MIILFPSKSLFWGGMLNFRGRVDRCMNPSTNNDDDDLRDEIQKRWCAPRELAHHVRSTDDSTQNKKQKIIENKNRNHIIIPHTSHFPCCSYPNVSYEIMFARSTKVAELANWSVDAKRLSLLSTMQTANKSTTSALRSSGVVGVTSRTTPDAPTNRLRFLSTAVEAKENRLYQYKICPFCNIVKSVRAS